MKSAMRLIGLLLTLPLAAACASSPTVLTPGAPCSSLIPAGWTEPVPSAALPPDQPADADQAVRDWQVFGVQQTGQLRTANGRTSDVIGVVTACERRDAQSVRDITRPWYRRLLPG